MTVLPQRSFSASHHGAAPPLPPKMGWQRNDEVSIIDMDGCLSPNKVPFVGKTLKKESFALMLLILVFLGLCALSACFVHVGQRKFAIVGRCFSPEAILCHISSCSKDTKNSNGIFPIHYPRPVTFKRNECDCTPVHKFVILSMQRSGSGWFETLLNNHPNISSHGEIFARRAKHANFAVIVRRLNEVYNLDYYSSAAKNSCTSAVGFKWMLNQGVMEYQREIALYFKEKGVSVIFLLRRNLLKRLVSILANAYDREMKLINGTHKSHVHSKQEAETLASFKPIINHKALPGSFHRIHQVIQDALNAFSDTRHIILYYEDLVKSKESLDRVQNFLGLSPISLESQQVKIHTRPLSEEVRNWDSVYRTLKGTEYEEFLTQNEYI